MHPSLALRGSPHGQDPSGIPWRGEGEDPAAGSPRRAPGRSRGSAGGPLPGPSCARSWQHRSGEAPVPLQQEPAQGQRGGTAVRGSAGARAGGRRGPAPCAPHRPTASGCLGRCGAGADGSPRWQRGKQEVVLPCKAVRQPVSLRWSLQGRQEGTWDTGAAAKGTWSKADRARAGLDACCWDPMGRERMSRQGHGACEPRQEGLEMERRKTVALQGEKLELQKRLRELEHRSRSLLRQRQEVLRRLHVLLLQEKVDALRQLQEALEQQLLLKERAVGTPRLQHCLSHPWELPGHGDHLSVPVPAQPAPQQCHGAGPVPAAVSHTLHARCGLQEQIQQHMRELQREPREEGQKEGGDLGMGMGLSLRSH